MEEIQKEYSDKDIQKAIDNLVNEIATLGTQRNKLLEQIRNEPDPQKQNIIQNQIFTNIRTDANLLERIHCLYPLTRKHKSKEQKIKADLMSSAYPFFS